MLKKIAACLFITGVLLGLHFKVIAQQNNKELANQYLEMADEIYFEQQAIEVAKEQYILAAQTDSTNVRANYMAGKTFMETVNKEQATKYFLRVFELDPDYRFDILYSIGRAFQYKLSFEKALNYYQQYLQKLENNSEYRGEDKIPARVVQRRIYESKNGLQYVNNPADYTIVNVGEAVNSDMPDYAPVLNREETVMIFTSRRREGNLNEDVYSDNFPYEDIFISRKENGEWSEAENIGEDVNTPFFDSNLALSADGTQLYIYKDENQGDIFVTQRKNDTAWASPQPIGENINSTYSEQSVSISPDGQKLFFASDRPGGYGGIDIYMSEKDRRGDWRIAENIGQTINTAYDEDGPFIDYDGKTLYFSSRGHKGMGGYDIYRSVYDEQTGEWSEPENMGYPINTADDDIYFVSTQDGQRGYFASVREDGMGYLDIYMVTVPEDADPQVQNTQDEEEVVQQQQQANQPDTTATVNENSRPDTSQTNRNAPQAVSFFVRVEDAQTGQPINAQINLRSTNDNFAPSPSKINTGTYRFDITKKETADYMLSVEKQGYMFQNFELGIPGTNNEKKSYRRRIQLKKARIGEKVILRNIYFHSGNAKFTDGSYDELNKLLRFLQANPNLNIEVAGHTDNIGGKDFNKKLSLKRARAVINYLSQKGIDKSRLTAKGYGESRPLASNDDEREGRELNRRVEFSIIGNNNQQ